MPEAVIGTWQRPSEVDKLQSTHVRAVLQACEHLGVGPANSNEVAGQQRTLTEDTEDRPGGVRTRGGCWAVHVTLRPDRRPASTLEALTEQIHTYVDQGPLHAGPNRASAGLTLTCNGNSLEPIKSALGGPRVITDKADSTGLESHSAWRCSRPVLFATLRAKSSLLCVMYR